MYLYYNCTRAVKFSNSRQRLNFEEGGRSAILRRGGHLVHKIKNILDERRGAAFLTERRGGHCCMHLVGVMEGGMEGGGGAIVVCIW